MNGPIPPPTIERDGVTLRDGVEFWWAMEPADWTGFIQQWVAVPAEVRPVPEGYSRISEASEETLFEAGLFNKFLVLFPAWDRSEKVGAQ